jgi:Tol biopolymer transport system component
LTTSRALVAVLAVLSLGASTEAQGRRLALNTIRTMPLDGRGEGKTLTETEFFYVGSPHFSPDGQWVAFDGYKGDAGNAHAECWVVKTDGTGLRKLADGATPRWSPDGRRLLFMRDRRPQDQGGDTSVYVINADGTGEKRLFDGRWPDWSPDGKKIAFSIGGRKTPSGSQPGTRTRVANADGSDVKEVAVGDCPSWSPDGKKVACRMNDPAFGSPLIRLVELDDLDAGQVILGPRFFRANWSADGKSVYTNGPGGPSRAVRMPAETGGRPEPIPGDVMTRDPCPSPDGKRLVFCTTGPAVE